jgi:hypothetical protein
MPLYLVVSYRLGAVVGTVFSWRAATVSSYSSQLFLLCFKVDDRVAVIVLIAVFPSLRGPNARFRCGCSAEATGGAFHWWGRATFCAGLPAVAGVVCRNAFCIAVALEWVH